MVTVWILLIFSLLGELASCSSGPSNAPPSEAEIAQALSSLDKVEPTEATYGPTHKSLTAGFVDRTADYGLAGVEGVTFAAVDLNRDLFEDLIVFPNYYSQPRFFLFDSTSKKFQEVKENFFDEIMQASYLVFADFNRDEVPDVISGVLNQRGELTKQPLHLWLGKWDEKNRLHFKRDTKFPLIPPGPASTVIPLDFDLDGRLDFFIGNWFEERKGATLPVADQLFWNRPDGFENKTDLLTGESTQGPNELYPSQAKPTYGASTCDIDQDGWPDILTASSGGHYNKLWMNRSLPGGGGRRFEDWGKASGYAADPNGILVPTSGGRTFTSICADYNDDGIMDVFLGELTHGWDPLSADRSSVLTGAKKTWPPSFLRTEYMSDNEVDNWNQGDKRAQWVDLNLDGLIDLLVDNSGFPPASRLVAFAQDESRAFVNQAEAWGIDVVNPTGTIVLDINHDGRPDILTGQHNIRKASIKNRLWLLENHLQTTGRAVEIHLDGKRANQWGLGAMVMLYTQDGADKVIQRRWHESTQGGLPSQRPEGVHFGLASGAKVMGLKVRWPILEKGRNKPLERLYQIKDDQSQTFQVFTLCEDGSAQVGRFRCGG